MSTVQGGILANQLVKLSPFKIFLIDANLKVLVEPVPVKFSRFIEPNMAEVG